MIKKLILNGFNGQNREYDLKAKNLFVGPRGAGKSTVMSAIEYVLNRIPPNQSWPLHSNPADQSQKSFSVTLVFDDGFMLKRETKLTKTGCVGTLWKGTEEPLAKVGANDEALLEFPATINNADAFVGASDNKKMEMLFTLFAKKLQMTDNPESLANAIGGLERKIVALQADLKTATIAAEQVATRAKEIGGSESLADLEEEYKANVEQLNKAKAEYQAIRDEETKEKTLAYEAELKRKAEEAKKNKPAPEESTVSRGAASVTGSHSVPVYPPVAFSMPSPLVDVSSHVAPDEAQASVPAIPPDAPKVSVVPPSLDVLHELAKIVDMATEKNACHACGIIGFANPVLIPLKMLVKKIKEARLE